MSDQVVELSIAQIQGVADGLTKIAAAYGSLFQRLTKCGIDRKHPLFVELLEQAARHDNIVGRLQPTFVFKGLSSRGVDVGGVARDNGV